MRVQSVAPDWPATDSIRRLSRHRVLHHRTVCDTPTISTSSTLDTAVREQFFHQGCCGIVSPRCSALYELRQSVRQLRYSQADARMHSAGGSVTPVHQIPYSGNHEACCRDEAAHCCRVGGSLRHPLYLDDASGRAVASGRRGFGALGLWIVRCVLWVPRCAAAAKS